MRKNWVAVLLTAALLLTGCASGSEPLPSIPGWDGEGVRMGPLLGVAPLESFTLDDYEDSQAVKGIYYATWVSGEAHDHPTEKAEDARIYDAQIYVLLKKCEDPEAAKTELDTWTGWEKDAYKTGETQTLTCAGQSFDVFSLEESITENPYHRGLAAFALHDSWAISVELLYLESFTGDPQTVLNDFLSGFHYGEGE